MGLEPGGAEARPLRRELRIVVGRNIHLPRVVVVAPELMNRVGHLVEPRGVISEFEDLFGSVKFSSVWRRISKRL